jgi:hypothetical protein
MDLMPVPVLAEILSKTPKELVTICTMNLDLFNKCTTPQFKTTLLKNNPKFLTQAKIIFIQSILQNKILPIIFLLRLGYNPVTFYMGDTHFQTALKTKKWQIAEILLEYSDKDPLDIFIAIGTNDVDVVTFLLDHDYEVNAIFDRERLKTTPLIFAIRGGNIDIVHALLLGGADPNLSTDTTTPLVEALGNIAIATLLLEYGADPNKVTISGVSVITALSDMLSRGETIGWAEERSIVPKKETTQLVRQMSNVLKEYGMNL